MTVLAAIIWGLAAVVVVGGMLLRRGAQKQKMWLPIEGRILESSITLGRYWYPRVSYAYTHGGREFRGDRIRSLEISMNWRSPAGNDIDRYPPGKLVTVYVNPDDPYSAVLEPGGHWWFLPFTFSFAAILLFFGLSLR
jgi:Protein of unknown function (DUF3592)